MSIEISNLLSNEPVVFGFMHIATHGRWREIVAEQIALIRASALYERSSRIFIGIVGDECDAFDPGHEKFEVIYRSKDVREFEFPTLRHLRQTCEAHDCLVYYIHTKGVFKDRPTTDDWRRYMEYFVVERYADCLAALMTHDICGVDWLWHPWPHYSGNFWWARSSYVRSLPHIEALDVINVLDHDHRHICERWIGTGQAVRAATLHQSHVDHYENTYSREAYAVAEREDESRPAENEANVRPSVAAHTTWLSAGDAVSAKADGLRVAMIFDNVVRPDTTGGYCQRAMSHLASVSHFLPSELANIPPDAFDLYLYIDDGLDYDLRPDLRPSAMWAIDTHLNPERLLRRAKAVDTVFAAQRDGVELFRSHGINCIGWLPLACDPEVHRRHEVEAEFEVCFVGNLSTPERHGLADLLRARFPKHFVGQRFFEEMARKYSASHIVLNASVRNDINMRVFEALACGSLLITNDDVRENGVDELFSEGEHLVTYRWESDLVEKIAHFLADPAERMRIAAAGQAEVLRAHTYLHRMQTVLHFAGCFNSNVPPPLTSIVIVTFNALAYTKFCLESIARCTPEPYEIIIVDNGSHDGTPDYVRRHPSIRSIANETNRGFAAASNQGITGSRGERIVLLNNDTVVTPGWLRRLHAALEQSSDIGLVGPSSNAVSGSQQVPVDYSELPDLPRFAAEWSKQHRDEIIDTDRLIGFCMLFRRSLIHDIGLLDEQFAIGNFEDDDFCRRAGRAGYRAVIARECFIHHFGSVSFRENGIDHGGLMERNRRLFHEKWDAPSPESPADEIIEVNPFAIDRPCLSVCMIVRDNARTIRACLQSIKPWVDEMVVIDTGSTDETPLIAIECGARLFHFPWCDDFAKARNRSLEAARGEWLFWMDSDDTIDEANGRRLRQIADREHEGSVMGFAMQVRCPSGKDADGNAYATDTIVDHIKLVRNHPALRFEGRIHEQILPSIRRLGGKVEWADVQVVHSGSDSTPLGRARKHERDLRLLKLELQEKPDDTFALFNLGMTFLDADRAAEALAPLCQSLQRAEAGESHVRKIYSLIAQTYSALGRRETALKTCRQGLNVCPGDPELLFRKGVLEQTLGAFDVAEQSFRQLLETPRERHFSSIDGGILGVKAWHNLAVLYDQQRRYPEAVSAWERVLNFDEQNHFAWRGLLDSLSAARDVTGIRCALERAERPGAPIEIRAMARLRLSLITSGPDQAIGELQAIALEPESSMDLLSELAEVAFTHGRLDVAEDALIEFTRRKPADASARLNLASIYLKQAQYEKAAKYAQQSLQLRPGHPLATHVLEQASTLVQEAPAELQAI